MNTIVKRFLSSLLLLAMLISMVPSVAFADENAFEVAEEQSTEFVGADAEPFAAEALSDDDDNDFAEDDKLCDHHPVHEDCGYKEAVEASPCTHEHGEECYALSASCTHVHGDGCDYVAAVEGSLCMHSHDELCAFAEAIAEIPCDCEVQLIHAENCAYIEGVAESICDCQVQLVHAENCAYTCAVEGSPCLHSHDEQCGYSEGVPAQGSCAHVCTEDNNCIAKALACPHVHDDSCAYKEYAAAVPCDYECEICTVKTGYGYYEAFPDEEFSNEDAYVGYLENLFYDNAISTYGVLGRDKLSTDSKSLYDYLKTQISKVASGELASTAFSPNLIYTITCDSVEAGLSVFQAELSKTLDALRHDCPYDLYWSDGNYSYSYSYSWITYGQTLNVTVKLVKGSVAGNYRLSANDSYTFNTAYASSAVAASRNAKNIVSQYSGYSDYQKLLAYKNKICDLVEYDYAALDKYNADPYYPKNNNTPWQLINVFDNNTNTNVVCEGYAEAFQYLCDLSDFSNDVSCYSVSGYADGGGHEWNIVNANGTSYHVDVTWCDGGHTMFMVGGSGSISNGYTIKGSKYVYYEDVKLLWGTGSNSILKLSASDLSPNSLDNKPTHSHSYSAKVTAPTCTAQGYTTYTCSCGDTYKSNYVAAKGHSYGAWTTTKAATCTATGTQRRDCNNCDYYETKSIAATGHKYTSKVTAPTCTAQGYTTYTCSCGDSYKSNYVSAMGHDFGAWYVIAGSGKECRDCNRCDFYELRDLLLVEGTFNGSPAQVDANGNLLINEVNFPDANFRNYISENYDSAGKGYLTEAAAKNVDYMFCGDEGIASLKGIEYFTALTYLSCEYNQLSSLDMSKNTALTDLWCENNQLTSLDVSKNTALTSLVCDNNQLSSLNVSKNTALIDLFCYSNKLSSLDVTKNPALTTLFCDDNQLSSLDVSKNPALTTLFCDDNQLSSLDVSKNTALTDLWCSNNQLSYLDVSKNVALIDLWCSNNQLSSLDVSKNTALIRLACDNNRLSTLDVSNNTALTDLWCDNNRLSYLDVSKNVALIDLCCYSNQLTNLFLRMNTKLKYLACNMQKATADAYMENGKYLVDMKEVVGTSNIANVTVTAGGTYDKLTGIVTLNTPASGAKTATLVYNYAHGSTVNSTMDVTLTVSLTNNAKLSVPTVTLGNNSSSGKPVVSWEEVPGAVGYEVYGKNSKASAYELYNYTESCSFTHNAAEIGETYYYRVRALHSNAAGNSAFSTAKAATCDLKMPTISVSNNASSGKPVVSWGAISGAASYDVYARSGQSSAYTKLTNTSSTSYSHSSAVAGETYIYKVRAVHSNAAANSAFSGGKGIVCDLKIPTLAVSTNAASGKPVVSWSAVAGAASYDIYARDSKTSVYTKLTNTSSTSYNHNDAEAGETYIYKVRAVHSNPSANSAFSGGMGVVCDLKMPTISISNNAATGKPTVSWSAISGASSYDIYARSSKTSVYTKLGNTSATSFNHSNAVAGETYFYKVRAVHTKASANSAFTGGKGYICDLAMPTINVSRAENGKPMVSWDVIPGAAGYEVYVRTSDNAVYTYLATAYGSSFIHSDAEKGEVYFYKVRAIHSNASANSVLSDGKGITSR